MPGGCQQSHAGHPPAVVIVHFFPQSLHLALTGLCAAHLSSVVVFGHVVEGMAVVKKIEAMGQESGKPKARITISDCGQVSVCYLYSGPQQHQDAWLLAGGS